MHLCSDTVEQAITFLKWLPREVDGKMIISLASEITSCGKFFGQKRGLMVQKIKYDIPIHMLLHLSQKLAMLHCFYNVIFTTSTN